ncbi:MAG: hypothetical protein AB7T06_00175 [Kofleriaceae bacterium]
MRSMTGARWATCALAMMIAIPLTACESATAGGKKSLDDCTSFDQVETSEEAMDLTIKSTCSIPIDCTVSWRVVCAPESKKRRATHRGNAKMSFPTVDTKSTQASAAVCGDDPWVLDSINWACEPNKD